LEKDPRRRYAGAQAVAEDLRAWLKGRPIAARPVGALERTALFVRRRPALAAAYGLLAAGGGLGGVGGGPAGRGQCGGAAGQEGERGGDGETKARAVAERARDGEAQARVAAEEARDGEARARAEAERQRENVERIDYGRTIEMAHQAWRENNIPATLALLGS